MELKAREVKTILDLAEKEYPHGGDSFNLALDAFFLNEKIEYICTDFFLRGEMPTELDESGKLALALIGAISMETLQSINEGRRYAGEISNNLNTLRQHPVLKVVLGKTQIVTVKKLEGEPDLTRAGYLIIEAMRQAYAGEKIKWQNVFSIVQGLHGFKASSQYEFKKLLGELFKSIDAENGNETGFQLIVDSKSGFYAPDVLDLVSTGYDPKLAIEVSKQKISPEDVPEFHHHQLPSGYKQPTFNSDPKDEPIYLKDLAKLASS